MSKPDATYTIAITGSIGCGKSAVRKCLEELGVAVIDADKVAHDLLSTPNPIYRAILERFGSDLVDSPGGPINRKKLGAIVFADAKALDELNALMHPAIRLVCAQRIKALGAEVVAVEVPLLFEAGQQDQYDEVWAVLAESKVRLQRLMERDHCTEEQAQMRIDAQWSQEKKAALATRIIDNSGTLAETREQVASCLSRARAARTGASDADASAEYKAILKRFGYLATDQALEQMGDLANTAHKEAKASMTLVVDSAGTTGGACSHRELQVDVHMSIKQNPVEEPPQPPPEPPPPKPPQPPPAPPPRRKSCWWLLSVLLAAIIAFWVIHPSGRDPGGGYSTPPPIVQTLPAPTPQPSADSPTTTYPAGSVESLSSAPQFIMQNVHNTVLARAAKWQVLWSADGSGCATVTAFDAQGRVIDIESYGPNLTFQSQVNLTYRAGLTQVDRFRPYNDFVGRTLYSFNNGGNLIGIRQLDGNQRLIEDALYKRSFGQVTAVELRFYDVASGQLMRRSEVSGAAMQAALSQRFYLFDMFGQLN